MVRWVVGLLMGLVGFVAVLTTIHAPGLTIDEPINVGHGKRMVWVLRHPDGQVSVKDQIEGLWGNAHEHPPLSRFLVGVSHHLFDPHPEDVSTFKPILGRPASAAAYGLILILVTVWTWKWGGPTASVAAGIATMSLPRLFGHAHFASPRSDQRGSHPCRLNGRRKCGPGSGQMHPALGVPAFRSSLGGNMGRHRTLNQVDSCVVWMASNSGVSCSVSPARLWGVAGDWRCVLRRPRRGVAMVVADRPARLFAGMARNIRAIIRLLSDGSGTSHHLRQLFR